MTSSYNKLGGQLFKAIVFLIPSGNCGGPPGVPAGVVCGSEPVVVVGRNPCNLMAGAGTQLVPLVQV